MEKCTLRSHLADACLPAAWLCSRNTLVYVEGFSGLHTPGTENCWFKGGKGTGRMPSKPASSSITVLKLMIRQGKTATRGNRVLTYIQIVMQTQEDLLEQTQQHEEASFLTTL